MGELARSRPSDSPGSGPTPGGADFPSAIRRSPKIGRDGWSRPTAASHRQAAVPYRRRQLRVYNRHGGDAPPHRISVVTGPRSRLINHLAGRLPGDTGHFDRTVETVKVDGQALTVTDRHGDEHTADVVVGVDGQRPAVRRAISSCRPAKVSCNGGSTSKGGVSSPTRRR